HSARTNTCEILCGWRLDALQSWRDKPLQSLCKEGCVSSEGISVTEWIAQLQSGNPSAAQHLWERDFRRLVQLAGKRLQGAARAAADEEDVALSAFASFCRGAREGRFPQLSDRNDLWRLLVVLTARKALHLLRAAHCQKRGGTLASSPEPEKELKAIVGRE